MPTRMSFWTFCTTSRMPTFIGSQVLLGLLSHWLEERSTTISAVGVRASKPNCSCVQPARSAASAPQVNPLSLDAGAGAADELLRDELEGPVCPSGSALLPPALQPHAPTAAPS